MEKLIKLLILSLLFSACSQEEIDLKQSTPNILVLIADDAGYRDFGCYGNENISTPNIDKLSNNGFTANNAFLTTPQCSPSRISVLTGKYPHATGAEDLHMPLPESEILLPTLLKEKKYFSGILKKAHLGANGEKQFDFYSKELNDFDKFLDSSKTQPFFLWVGFSDPHRPYKKNIISSPQDPSKLDVPPYFIDDDATREDLADYYNEIMRMDNQIGKYLNELEDRELLNHTLIIFFSDNGAPFPREKGALYDSGIKTPLIFYWKNGIRSGLGYDELISIVDLSPTILELVGIDIPKSMQGKSFSSTLTDPNLPGRKYVYSERNWHNCDEHIRSVRSERYKLILNSYTDLPHGTAADISNSPTWHSLYRNKISGKLTNIQKLLFEVPRPTYEFYDIENDPWEIDNLIDSDEYIEIINELKSELNDWIIETNDFSSDERRRNDNTDRITGKKFDQSRLPDRL